MPIVKRYTFQPRVSAGIASQFNTNFDDIIDAFNNHRHSGVGTDAPNITISGIQNSTLVGLKNPYKFYAYAGSAYNWGTNAWAKVALNTKLFDTSNNFSTTNYRYTAPIDGYYFFTGLARTSGAMGGNLYASQLWVNGAIGSGLSGLHAIQGAGTSAFGAPVSGLLQLTAGNYVELAVYGTGNAGASGRYETYLMGFLVSGL